MFRSTLIAAGAVALCGVGFAQQRLDPAKIRPVTGPIRDAGVFDWQTKQWVSGPKANQLLASQYTVYRNDCTWATQAYYFGIPECWDQVDEGELPATDTPFTNYPGMNGNVHVQSGVPISGYTDDQIISSAQFGYCTFELTGTVDIKIGFYDNLRGHCANGEAVKGKPHNLTLAAQAIPFGTTTAYFDFGSAAGFPLPGSSVAGEQSCWNVTITFPNNAGFCMQSEGDGSWDNDDDLDNFTWTFEHNNVPLSSTQETGPLISGEPNSEGFGAGAYNIPAGTDLFFGPANGFPIAPCGTGLNAWDGWWMNIDKSSQNVNPPAGSCSNVNVQTGCYWFGGWPGNPFGSFWMVMGSTGSCSGCSNRPSTYCTAGTTSSGCQALISAAGTSSATAATGFFLKAVNVEGSKDGQVIYGTNGAQANSWGQTSSFQCVVPPVRRGGLQSGVGTNGLCDGSFSQDLNARWTAKPAHNPGPGATVWAQYWYRDPLGPAPDTALSNAITWTVCP